jgi:hypothetical protein
MTIHFPWASLLRGVLGRDDAVLAGVAGLLAPGAHATVLVSVVPRDGVPAIPAADAPTPATASTSSRRGRRTPPRSPRRTRRGPSGCGPAAAGR